MTAKSKTEPPTRDRILDAALETFGRKGFAAATTKEVAKAAGVNEVTVFRLFGSKLRLFEAVMEERSMIKAVREGVDFDPNHPLDDLLYGNVRFVLSTLRQNKHMFTLMIADATRVDGLWEAWGDIALSKGVAMLSGFMGMLMAQGRVRKMDPEIAARAAMGLVQSYFITNDIMLGKRPDEKREEEMLRGFVSILLDGIRGEEG